MVIFSIDTVLIILDNYIDNNDSTVTISGQMKYIIKINFTLLLV